eukprot:6129601-Pyramimonas_sp.AAC.1
MKLIKRFARHTRPAASADIALERREGVNEVAANCSNTFTSSCSKGHQRLTTTSLSTRRWSTKSPSGRRESISAQHRLPGAFSATTHTTDGLTSSVSPYIYL